MRPQRLLPLLALAALALPPGGCVERRLLLQSEPPGLEVTVNGLPAGRTPVEIPFTWYGTVRLETAPADRDGDGWPEVRRSVAGLELDAPWYEWFPLDFFSENLLPFTVVDRHEVVLRPPLGPPPNSPEEEEALRRAVEPLRARAGEARREAEAPEAEPAEE